MVSVSWENNRAPNNWTEVQSPLRLEEQFTQITYLPWWILLLMEISSWPKQWKLKAPDVNN